MFHLEPGSDISVLSVLTGLVEGTQRSRLGPAGSSWVQVGPGGSGGRVS